MGQYRKATVRFSINSKEIEKAINRQMADITDKTKEAGMLGVKKYLDDLREYTMNFHPWNNRTGNLRDSHKVIKTPKGYGLKADPRATGKSDYDYGGLLEFGKEKGLAPYIKDYSWIRPAHRMRKHKLPSLIEKEIQKEMRNRK